MVAAFVILALAFGIIIYAGSFTGDQFVVAISVWFAGLAQTILTTFLPSKTACDFLSPANTLIRKMTCGMVVNYFGTWFIEREKILTIIREKLDDRGASVFCLPNEVRSSATIIAVIEKRKTSFAKTPQNEVKISESITTESTDLDDTIVSIDKDDADGQNVATKGTSLDGE